MDAMLFDSLSNLMPPSLGDSQHIAKNRLYSLERKFKTQPQFHSLYVDFMRDCEKSQYMTRVTASDLSPSHCFLPHHGVFKQNGDFDTIRVVYDASSQTSSGNSLNDILLTGPKLQINICDILLRFRTHNVGFTCDIRKMYSQIVVHPSDQHYQMVLWRECDKDTMSIFKLTRVTFGVNCSPYLAIGHYINWRKMKEKIFRKQQQFYGNRPTSMTS